MYTSYSLLKIMRILADSYGMKITVTSKLNGVWGEYDYHNKVIRINKNIYDDFDIFKMTLFHEIAHMILDHRGKLKKLHRGTYYRSKNRELAARRAVLDEIKVDKYSRYLQKRITGILTVSISYGGVDNNEVRDEPILDHYIQSTIRSWEHYDGIISNQE